MGNGRNGKLTSYIKMNFYSATLKFCTQVFTQARFHTCFFYFLFQLEVLKHYLDEGGNVLVMLGEGGEMKFDTNINFLLEEFGIMVNNGACWNLLKQQFTSTMHL